MDNLPLISIIVPIYNVKEHLERCVRSICAQTYRNLEIILVNDGSTDGSGELCEAFARNDERIRVIHQANSGQAAARNRALNMVSGEYLGFVDADDWIEPDMYQFLYNLLVEYKADISICSHYRDRGAHSVARFKSGRITNFSRDEAIRALVTDRHVRNYMWDKLFKRRVFEGVTFPINRVFEDVAICYRLFYGARRLVMQDTPKYHYIIREGSTTRNNYNPKKDYDLFLSIYEQARFITEKGIWDKSGAYLIRNGIRLIDYAIREGNNIPDLKTMRDIIAKMHKFDHISHRQLGFISSFKRYLIYRHINAYQKGYVMLHSILHVNNRNKKARKP